LPQQFCRLAFTLDHIVAQQHGGSNDLANVALACGFCNRHKGPNIAGLDSGSGRISRLYNPRLDYWGDHFQPDGPMIVGLTTTGRATIAVLSINHPLQLSVRQSLIDERLPPF